MTEYWMKDLRERAPRVHCITNYVTAGDVANLVLAAGGSPIMAQGRREVEDVTSICHSLVLNMGTLEKRTVKAMLLAGRRAKELGHPVILDPVGVTSSSYRRQSALGVLEGVKPDIIRGNESEIRALEQALRGLEPGNTTGVDASPAGGEAERLGAVRALAERTGAVVVMTGAADLIAGHTHIYRIENGSPMMGRITGGGCMLDGLLGAFCGSAFLEERERARKAETAGRESAGKAETAGRESAVQGIAARSDGASRKTAVRIPRERLEAAAAAAVSAHGICGETAEACVRRTGAGTGSFRMYFMDAMSRLDDEALERGKRIEIL